MKMGMCWSSSSPISNVKTQSSASVTYGVSTEMSKVAFSGNSDSSGNSGSSASTFNEDSYPNGMILPHPNLKIFSFTELKVATENFRSDMVLGEGGFGKVYKGNLDDKSNSKSGVAVKKLKSESAQGFQEWQSEIKFLGRLSHPNLVKLLGYCWEDTEAESILHGTSTPTKDKAVISGTPEKQEGKRSTETPETKTDDTAAKKVRLDFTQTT